MNLFKKMKFKKMILIIISLEFETEKNTDAQILVWKISLHEDFLY